MASLPHTPPAATSAPSSQLRERNLKALFGDSWTAPEHTAINPAEADQSIPGAFPSETDLKNRKEEDAKAGHASSTIQGMKHTVEALADYAKEYLPASLTAYMGGRKKENADGEPSDSTKDKQPAVGPYPKDNMPHHNLPEDAPKPGGIRIHTPEHCDNSEPISGKGVGDPLGSKEPHSTPSQPPDIHAKPHEQSLATVPESPQPTAFDEVKNRLRQDTTPKTLKRGLDTSSSTSTTSKSTSSRNPQAFNARDTPPASSTQTETRNDSTTAESPTLGRSGGQEIDVSSKPTEHSDVRARDADDGTTIEGKKQSPSAPAATIMEQPREPSKKGYAPNTEPVGIIPHEGPKGETLASASTSASTEQHGGIKEIKGKDNRRRSHGSRHGSKDKEGTHEVEGQGTDEKSKGGFGKRLSGFFRRKSPKQQRESEGNLGSESPHSSGSTSPAQSASTPRTPTSPQSAVPTEPQASFFGEEMRREQPREGGLFPLRQAQKEQKGRQREVETGERKTIFNVGERPATNQGSPQPRRDPSALTPSKSHAEVSPSDHAKKATPIPARGASEGPVTGSVPEQRSVPLGLETGVSGPTPKAQGGPHPEAARRGLVSGLVHGAEEVFYDAGDVARNFLPGMVGGYLPHHQETKGDIQATSASRSPEKSPRSHMASPSAQRQPAPTKPSAPKQPQTPSTAPGAQIRAQQGDVDRDVEGLKRQARPGAVPTSTLPAHPPKGQLPADARSTAQTELGTPTSLNISSHPSRSSSAEEISPRAQLSTREQISGKPSNIIEPLREEYIKSVIDDSNTSFGTGGTLPGYPSQAGLGVLIGERMYDDHMRAAGAKEPVQTTTNTLKREAHLKPQQVVEANPSVNVAGLRVPRRSAHRMGSELSTTAERRSTSGLNSEGSVPAEESGKKIDPGIPLPGELDFNMWTSTGSAPKPDSGPAQHPYGARIRVDDLGVPINTDTQERKDYLHVQKNGGKNMSIN